MKLPTPSSPSGLNIMSSFMTVTVPTEFPSMLVTSLAFPSGYPTPLPYQSSSFSSSSSSSSISTSSPLPSTSPAASSVVGASPADTASSSSSKNSTAAAIGGSIGGFITIVIFALIVWLVNRRPKPNPNAGRYEDQSDWSPEKRPDLIQAEEGYADSTNTTMPSGIQVMNAGNSPSYPPYPPIPTIVHYPPSAGAQSSMHRSVSQSTTLTGSSSVHNIATTPVDGLSDYRFRGIFTSPSKQSLPPLTFAPNPEVKKPAVPGAPALDADRPSSALSATSAVSAGTVLSALQYAPVRDSESSYGESIISGQGAPSGHTRTMTRDSEFPLTPGDAVVYRLERSKSGNWRGLPRTPGFAPTEPMPPIPHDDQPPPPY